MGGLMLVPLARSLATLREAGLARIAAHVDALQARLLDRLGDTGWKGEASRLQALRRGGHLGPILGLFHGGRGGDAMNALLKAGAARHLFTSVREGYLRLALHGWHTEADVDRLAGWLAEG